MLAKTLFASAASVAVLTLAAISLPATAQKAPANAPAAAAAPAPTVADEVINAYEALAADLALNGKQKTAYDAYAKAVGKVVAEHEKWHEKFGVPPRGDRQAHFKFRAEHEKFRAGQYESLAAARAELVKNLTGDQIALLDEMEDGYYGPGMRFGRGAAGPGPRFGRGPGPDPRFDGGPARPPKPGKHHRFDGYGPGYGPGCGWGPHGGWGHGWGHGWGYGPGYGSGYGPGCNWNGCPWR